MDVGELASMYGGLPARVVTRAREILRLATAKRTISVDMTTPIACLVVACRAMDEPIDVKKLAALLGISARSVDQVARKIFKIVNIQSTHKVTPASLCVRHGCAEISELVNRVYAEYQLVVLQIARGHGSNGGARLFDPSDPVFAAACLYATAKRAKRRVDRATLVADVCANPRAFDAVVSSIEAHCGAALAGGVASSAPTRAVRVVSSSTSTDTRAESKQRAAKTKAAQRAAMVLEKAVQTTDKKSVSKKRERDEAKATPTEVTADEYQAWKARVLALRRREGLAPFTASPQEAKSDEGLR